MRSEKIAEQIMSEVYKEVKDFVANIIANRRTVDFEEIETEVSKLSARFSKRVAEGALSSSKKEVTEAIKANVTYFTNNKERMRYNEYKTKGYHIGSGTVESACKHVVGQRLKQAGMRWSVAGADAILQLRIRWKNGEWNKFWDNRKLAA